MNTPAHLLIGMAAFSKRDRPKVTLAAAVGAILPDLSLYLMAGYALFIAQISPNVVFGQMYFSEEWTRVFRIDNSFVLWGLLLALGLWRKWPILIALSGAALLHIALDFPLHHNDGRPHFWPISNWVFESPFSYWDRAHGASWIGPIEGLIALGCTVLLWIRHTSWAFRAAIVVLLLLNLRTNFVWLFVFGT